MMKEGVSVVDATHVKTSSGTIERIVSKWGVSKEGWLSKPSEGGFGVVTETGNRVSMWEARLYLKEE